MGYYSPLQTELSNYFRGSVIEWLKDKKNLSKMKELEKYMDLKKKNTVNDYIIKLGSSASSTTNCLVELSVLSYINPIPIVIYNELNIPIFAFDSGLVYDSKTDKHEKIKKYTDKRNDTINMRFVYMMNNESPDLIETLYFKQIK